MVDAQGLEIILNRMEQLFRRLEYRVPRPIKETRGDHFVFRYKEKAASQAIVQKLARILSGLLAIKVLIENGLRQEQGAMQRIVSEICEDVQFISLGIINCDLTELHYDYLKRFYLEEFDEASDAVGSRVKRGMVRRTKIRSYIHRACGLSDPSMAEAVGKTLHSAYSVYVHAASPHIMDMFVGAPFNRFDVTGSWGRLKIDIQIQDAQNYFLRGVMTMAMAAKALEDNATFISLIQLRDQVESQME